MTRIGRDSTIAADIPLNGLAVAFGYANGASSAWGAADHLRFDQAGIPIAWIDVIGDRPDVDILDIETGDASVSDAPGWVQQHNARHAGYPAILYCNRSTLTPLFNTLTAAGLVVVRDFRLWIATLDGVQRVADMTGVTAVQYKGEALTGGHYDESVIYDDSWKARTPAAPHLVRVTATASFSDGTSKTWTVQ